MKWNRESGISFCAALIWLGLAVVLVLRVTAVASSKHITDVAAGEPDEGEGAAV